jgi:hypothetical protein
MTHKHWDEEPREQWEEDEDSEFEADGDESDADGSDDGAAEVVDCPSCGEPVYEDAEQCPACGEFIEHSTSPLIGRQPWMVTLFLAGVVAVIIACIALF